ncbi:hypothetical protein LTSEUGA_0477 [Salmonella enterica subsp. enterica serovar Uganda str. R8-3404]|uniref:Uncharacterized protein n=1 Tax=Salmonella enterica subsp. enterica serovar Uganda str. R8-3404 TaxID=913083 RepID=A0A6C8H6J7_SALET|nr:hypothetical protein LTSEUGA_0477 [Salmonella enterica subsp. enterica serovar Uganda str. R8-3404]
MSGLENNACASSTRNFQPGAMPTHSPCKQPAAHRGGIVSLRNSP